MKHLFYLLFLFQVKTCNAETISTQNKKVEVVKKHNSTTTDFLINSVDKKSIGKKIIDVKKIKLLKEILIRSYEREVERPYMWDIFDSENDNLLQFFVYKKFTINKIEFTSYFVKINYEDASYQAILLINEKLDKEYNCIVAYERLESEEKYSKTTKVSGDKIQLMLKKPTSSQDIFFQAKDGLFLDYLEVPSIDKKWKDKENSNFDYKLKGKISNHLKNGYWIEKRYSMKYNNCIIEDGNYINGIRNGEWNYSPDGPVDMIKTFDKGKAIKTSYP